MNVRRYDKRPVVAMEKVTLLRFKTANKAESVGLATYGHMTKMAVTPFDPPLPKTPSCTQTS